MSVARSVAETGSGAKMSPRLAARIHHTLGRAHDASPEQAILYGEELIQAIQLETESVFKRGVDVHVPSAPLASDRHRVGGTHDGS